PCGRPSFETRVQERALHATTAKLLREDEVHWVLVRSTPDTDQPGSGAMADTLTPDPIGFDELFLRRSFDVARRAMGHGNHPFGAVLVDGDRNVLIEVENGFMPSHDGTAHAERLLATKACTIYSAEVLK